MRREFGQILVELAERDSSIVLIVGDLGGKIFQDFKEKFPDRYFNFGACEQSMVSAAAGMALKGLKPYLYSITPFLLERPFEQIKIDMDHQNVNVKLVGYADYPELGPTHKEMDWKRIGELLKNTELYFPKTVEEAKEALFVSYNHGKPTIISLKKAL